MNTLDYLHRLLDHLEWSNQRVLQATRDAENHEGLRLLSHLLAAERVWLERLTTGDSSGLEIWPDDSFEECADLLEENSAAYRRYLGSLTPEELKEDITYRNSSGSEYHTPAGEILFHVFLHGSYHRGQIAKRLRYDGHEPVNTDFITFVRGEPQDAEVHSSPATR